MKEIAGNYGVLPRYSLSFPLPRAQRTSLAKAPPHLARDVSESWREGGQDVLWLSSHVVRRLGTSASQIEPLWLSYDYIEVLKLRIGGVTKSSYS